MEEDSEVAKKMSADEPAGPTFSSTMARQIYSLVTSAPSTTGRKGNDMFKPGRSAYVYDIDEEFSSSLPTTVYRSKAEYSTERYIMKLEDDAPLISRLSNLLCYLRGEQPSQGKKMRRKQKKIDKVEELKPEIILAEPEKKAYNSDDDIFQDVGTDYQVEEKGTNSNVEREVKTMERVYFGEAEKSQNKEDKPDKQPTFTYRDLIDDDSKKSKAKDIDPESRIAQIMQEEEDAYAEFYPDYGGFAGENSDEERGEEEQKKITPEKKEKKGKGTKPVKDVKLDTQYTKLKQVSLSFILSY